MKIIFIYNAQSDLKNRLLDFAHKMIKPASYKCQLCLLTHHNFGEKEKWKSFVNENKAEIEFYHIDEFEEKFTERFDYPIAVNASSDPWTIILSREEIYGIGTEDELIEKINNYLVFNTI
jgi:hypothetical protein